ncbi:membrane protein insertase YidC [Patescibacteria group bacterium]|nr:membrane protein insertase YidC [Patescibacteria group bacterium]
MELLINIFNKILYQPLFNILVLLYQYLPGKDLGIAIIFLTLLTKALFYPLSKQSIKSQKALSNLQPKIQDIQKKYKDDKEKQALAMMELYQKEKINPFSGLLPLFLQIPILIALYRVFLRGFHPEEMLSLYNFIPHPGNISPLFLGILDLNKPSPILAIFTGVFQFFQSKMVAPKAKGKTDRFSQIFQKQILYFFPIFTIFILLKLPSAIGLYWLVVTIFSIIQQYFILKKRPA